YDDYAARMAPAPTLIELTQSDKNKEAKDILAKLDKDAFVVILDERGKELGSTQFADVMQIAMNNGKSHLQAVIGGADGLTDEIRQRADLILAFGRLTWPHMLARIMLLEQLYRAKQILAGHPYHREG
ncbi:MAG TPA: 23S rRNA (pseudouridine(1915)-N(3))-methyltransferase RlmH, partial [Alphaproteobacteria bacterium]